MAYARNSVDGKEYFSRVIHALADCGKQVLLHLLHKRVGELTPKDHCDQPWSLDEFLNHKRTDIMIYIGRDIIKKDILYPFNQDTDLTKWDISLFVFVLLIACELDDNDSLHCQLKHDICNFREMRNKMSHKGTPTLNKAIYRHYFGRIVGAVERICDFMQEPDLKKSLRTELDKYQSLRHIYPNGLFSELGCKSVDMINEADAAVENSLQKMQVIIQKMGLSVNIPVIEVIVMFRNYNKEDERALTEQFLRIFSEALEHSTKMSADRSSSELEVEVKSLVHKLLAVCQVSAECEQRSYTVESKVQGDGIFVRIQRFLQKFTKKKKKSSSSKEKQETYKTILEKLTLYLQQPGMETDVLSPMQSEGDLPEGSIYDQIAYVPGRVQLHSQSVPSIEEDTTDEDVPKRSMFGQGRNHPVPSLEEETNASDVYRRHTAILSDDRGNRTVSYPSFGGGSLKTSALFCAAIDFGTTYTGYAFSSRHDQKGVFTMASEEHSSKVPTVVLFDQNKTFHSFGYEAQNKYQELLSRGTHREWYLFKDFKTTLFQTKELDENTPVKDVQDRIEMPAVDIFINAIRYMKEKALEHLRKQEKRIRDRDIHWVLTVPAIWNDAAKQFMRTAATKAGILNKMLSMALEQEAASIYCRDTYCYLGKLGTRYILLDLGGGTADMTCHKVVAGGLKELIGPEGGRFGGTNVDKSFIKLLVDIFGSTAVINFKKSYWNEFWEMMADFEMSKRKFDGNNRLIVKFPVHLEPYGEQSINDMLQRAGCSDDIEIKRGKMHISKRKGQHIFDETIDLVIERTQLLLKNLQLLGNVDYIVLVGGFSESKYLQTRMKAEFGDKVVAPTEPRTAVMKGAVLFGQNPAAIKTRVSKYTYGMATMNHFIPGIHPNDKRIVIDGHEYCDVIFEKHVTIGQEITVGQSMKEMTYHPTIGNQAHAVLQVFASSKENPKYVTDEDCRQVGLLLVEMDTGGYRNFDIKVKLIFGGTEIQVEVRDGHGILIKEARIDFLL